ncbi:MAG: PKD domain-containing protein [Bacteroidota bacterium]
MKKPILYFCLLICYLTIQSCTKSKDGTPSPKTPTAKAGDDQVAFVGELVGLDGSASTDPTGASLTYKWSFNSKPSGSTANIINADKAKPEFSPDKVGEYIATLTVSNGTSEGKVNTKITAGAGPFLTEFLNQSSLKYAKDTGSNSPGDAGYQFVSSKDIKVTHLAILLPEPGKYMVTIWNPQSTGVIYQGEVEQKAIGSLGSAKIAPNPIELAKDKKYIISVYYGGSPIYAADKVGGGNIFPYTNQAITVEGSRISSGSNAKPSFPSSTFQELYKNRGFVSFAYVEK